MGAAFKALFDPEPPWEPSRQSWCPNATQELGNEKLPHRQRCRGQQRRVWIDRCSLCHPEGIYPTLWALFWGCFTSDKPFPKHFLCPPNFFSGHHSGEERLGRGADPDVPPRGTGLVRGAGGHAPAGQAQVRASPGVGR